MTAPAPESVDWADLLWQAFEELAEAGEIPLDGLP